jgi:hypothetical protein
LLEVLESFVLGKRGDEATCEDAVVSTPHHVAVIDGATTEAGHEIEGKAPGRFTMETLSAAIRALAPDAEPAPAIGELSRALAAALREHGAEPGSLASACVLIASAQRREIWRVGNSVFTVDGTVHPQRWALVEIPARMRSAYLRALLRAKETTPDQIARNDPGQALIAPLLRAEHVFRNARDAGELTYTAIDGGEIPEELIEVGPLPGGADVVFASDGYPLAASTLAEAEEYLRASLAEDPLRIHRHPEVRGVRDGWVSYDDRAYVRFRLRA